MTIRAMTPNTAAAAVIAQILKIETVSFLSIVSR